MYPCPLAEARGCGWPHNEGRRQPQPGIKQQCFVPMGLQGPMGDTGHHWVGLYPKPRHWSWFGGCPRVEARRVSPKVTTSNGCPLGYGFGFRRSRVQGMDTYNWYHRYCVAIVLVGQWMMGASLVCIASPSYKLLDGASGKARSGSCHQYVNCECCIWLDCSNRDRKVER